MRACWLKWVGRDWSISADYIWLNYSDANNANDIVEALRRARRDAVVFKVLPQRPKKHDIGLPILESTGATQQFIRDGVDYFVRTRPADALSPDSRSVILERISALNAVNS